MSSQRTGRIVSLAIAFAAIHAVSITAQAPRLSWLDTTKPPSWNKAGLSIPAAPQSHAVINPRCRDSARPAELEEDNALRAQGWDLVGAYQGGWQMRVIRATAGYDGMCRPRDYQGFVFARGVFVGSLSPDTMDSRTDGALGQVFLLNQNRVAAEYARYSAKDALCCPSRTTRVEFEIANDAPVLRPLATSTSSNQVGTRGGTQSPGATAGTLEGTAWRAIELAGKAVPAQDPRRDAVLEFQSGGRVSGSDGCNRITGSYELKGDVVTFGRLAATQMACIDAAPDRQRAFRDALKGTGRLATTDDRLELFDLTGRMVAAFTPRARSADNGLEGTSWQLVKFQGGDDKVVTPDDGAKYTIEFGAGGRLAAGVDCNRGRGTWTSSDRHQVQFGPLALTRAKCPPESLHDEIAKQWTNIRSYTIKDGHLFLSLMADGGIYEYEPLVSEK